MDFIRATPKNLDNDVTHSEGMPTPIAMPHFHVASAGRLHLTHNGCVGSSALLAYEIAGILCSLDAFLFAGTIQFSSEIGNGQVLFSKVVRPL